MLDDFIKKDKNHWILLELWLIEIYIMIILMICLDGNIKKIFTLLINKIYHYVIPLFG